MKLSEAMRRGSKMAKQNFGSWTDGDGGCALMLTSLGAGTISKEKLALEIRHGYVPVPGELLKQFPILLKDTDSPCACNFRASAWHVVMHVNDVHRYTAERIAGWVESHLETPTYSMLQMQGYMADPEVAHVG